MAGNAYIGFAVKMVNSFKTLQTNLSDTTMMIIFIAAFGFIGLLIGINLIVTGLNYSKVSKLYRRLRRKN